MKKPRKKKSSRKRAKRKRGSGKKRQAIILVGSAQECPDIEYASGFRSIDPVMFVETGQQKYLIVSSMEQGRAEKGAKPGVTVVTPTQLEREGLRSRRASQIIRYLLRKEGVKHATVPATFPYGLAEALKKLGVTLRLCQENLFPGRECKDAREIRNIREAQQAGVIAMRAAITAIARSEIDYGGGLVYEKKPLTSERIRDIIIRVLVEHRCFCTELIVAGGKQAADPHQQGHGRLHAGEAIVIDIFPQHMTHGYWGDLTRTMVRGEPPKRLREMYNAVKHAHAEALAAVAPRTACKTVHRAAEAEFRRRGFKTGIVDGKNVGFIHTTGHGVGLAVHEAPSVGMSNQRLKKGNVITIEPGLYYPDIGGVRIEDTIVVTGTGWRYLVPCEKRFEV